MSRRTLLGAGLTAATVAVAVGAAKAGGVLDDALRGLGAEPHPEPDPGDSRRLHRAATDQAGLIAAIDATIAAHGDLEPNLAQLRLVADEQLVAVGGRLAVADVKPASGDPRAAAAALSTMATDSAKARETDAISTSNPDAARVLASMSAGLSQLAAALGLVAP